MTSIRKEHDEFTIKIEKRNSLIESALYGKLTSSLMKDIKEQMERIRMDEEEFHVNMPAQHALEPTFFPIPDRCIPTRVFFDLHDVKVTPARRSVNGANCPPTFL